MLLPEAERLLFRAEPTAEVIRVAHESIRARSADIESLEDKIRSLLTQISTLRHEQAKHKTAIEHSWGIVTLARRLPEDILIKIFGHCVDDGWTRAPVVVSHVCSNWRRAALAPKVWSHVYVRCDDVHVSNRTRHWLKMAGHAYLHIIVAVSWRVPARKIVEVMNVLVEHSKQWRSLSVETDLDSQADVVFGQCTFFMPELRRISSRTVGSVVAPPDGVDAIESRPLGEIFSADKAPQLNAVQYICGTIPEIPHLPSQITALTLQVRTSIEVQPLSASTIISMLGRLPHLQHLTLSMPLIYEHPFVRAQDPEATVFLPDLTTFTMYGPTDLNEMLPHFYTPRLRDLHLRSLEDLGYRQQPIGPTLTRFLELSTPPLELLELHDLDLSPEAFATTFAALPTLRELRLHESSISDTTVARLRGPRGLCPRLVRIDFRWCSMLHGHALVDLVRSRCTVDDLAIQGSDPIQEVTVVNCCFVMEDDVMELARTTVCRVVMREREDYCRERGCCMNNKYRTRLRFAT
ncbi:uncharacterized protein BXZ73DRAFT_92337 [Epithele typhae]|uniref:uncharacterized protein n=1 Tax=Epithele typhae TaxID=378194 RepID=UPI002008B528|nr:uncharacterized protein BXZ73DRAFT_92337 [Epithele typhae]KAH9917639.1 hypothetical protein BXZ73DRAFT_92337 [Epithele typhae]